MFNESIIKVNHIYFSVISQPAAEPQNFQTDGRDHDGVHAKKSEQYTHTHTHGKQVFPQGGGA